MSLSKLFLLPLLLAGVAPSVRADSLPNLLANGRFDQDLAGWSHVPTATWSFALGGTALVFKTPSPGMEVLSQCVGVEGGSLYMVSASVNKDAQQGDGGLALHVRWFDAAGCAGTILGGSPSLDFEPPVSVFEPKSRLLASPGAARSALVLFVLRADTLDGSPYVVDDVVFASAPFGEILTLPTAASVQGAFGQRFATDLWVRNTTAIARRFSLRIACPTCGQSPAWIVLNLGPSETRFLADVVFDYLGGGIHGRAGAVEIAYDPGEGALEVSARVATVNADQPGNGTAIPSRTRGEARRQATFIGLAGLGGDAGFRVNAGAFNPGDRAIVVTFAVRDSAGNDLGWIQRTWGPREWFQIDDVLAAAGAPAGTAASIRMDAEQALYPFAIAIDNRSGDPTWLEPAPRPALY
jgi:hypothetical protein